MHKSAKQCHKNLLHFDLSQKAEKRDIITPKFVQARNGKIEKVSFGTSHAILKKTSQYLITQILQKKITCNS